MKSRKSHSGGGKSWRRSQANKAPRHRRPGSAQSRRRSIEQQQRRARDDDRDDSGQW